jgi:hypothetical protein
MITILGILFPGAIIVHIIIPLAKRIFAAKKVEAVIQPKFLAAYTVAKEPEPQYEWDVPKPSLEIMLEGLKDTFNIFLKPEERIEDFFLPNLEAWRMIFWPRVRDYHNAKQFFGVVFNAVIELRGTPQFMRMSLEEKQMAEVEAAYDVCLEYYNSVCDDKTEYE